MSLDATLFELIPPEVTGLCQRLRAAGFEAYLVGGCVRDLLLGRQVHDWDVATSARPAQVQQLFARTLPLGVDHGTVAVVLPGRRQVEVTTFRGDGVYSDGRHPDTVSFGSSLEQDLERRDLTINAMAIEPQARRLVDPMAGRADLERRLIRAVGDARQRFAEDALRCMRAIRFAAVLEFSLAAGTLEAIGGARERFDGVSRERVRDELLKLLEAPRPSTGIQLMRESGLLADVLPELEAAIGVRQNRQHGEDVFEHSLRTCDALQGDALLRLAALLHDIGKPPCAVPAEGQPHENTFHGHEQRGAEVCGIIARRLRLSRADAGRLGHLVRHHGFPLEGWSDAGLRRLARRVGREHLDDLLELRRADLAGRDGPDQRPLLRELRDRLARLLEQNPVLETGQLAVDGHRLMEQLGIPPGPRVGQILRALLSRVLDDPALNTEEQLLELARKIEP